MKKSHTKKTQNDFPVMSISQTAMESGCIICGERDKLLCGRWIVNESGLKRLDLLPPIKPSRTQRNIIYAVCEFCLKLVRPDAIEDVIVAKMHRDLRIGGKTAITAHRIIP